MYIATITGRMSFLSPNQQGQCPNREKYHISWTCSPEPHLGFPSKGFCSG